MKNSSHSAASDNAPQDFRMRHLFFVIYLPHLIIAFTVGLTLPTLAILGQELGGSIFLAALPVTAQYLGITVFDIPAGALMSRFGSKNTALFGIILLIVASLLIILINDYYMLVISRLLQGAGLAMWLVSRQTYIAIAVPNHVHGRVASLVGGLFRIGNLVGAPVGGFMAMSGFLWFGDDTFLYAPFYLQLVLSCVVLVMFFFTVKKSRYSKSSWRSMPAALGETFRQNLGIFITAGAITITIQILRSVREVLIPLIGSNELDLSVGQIGIIQAVNGGFDAALFPVAGYVMDRYGRKFASVPALFILSVGIGLLAVVMNVADVWIFVVAAILIGIGNGLSSGYVVTVGADLAPSNHPIEFTGIWRIAADGGATIGPSLAGAISTGTSLSIAALSVMGIGLGALLVLIFLMPETLHKKHKKHEKHKPPKPD